ncbi:MAG: hypothetical protein ACNI3C_07730 [Candidatus Marinarcus sp.]|uniref:hypothetical protein n=1 Tax=Candidatus Marinarcus sp. TaxID=3100987 RepID=UPI003AFF842D
MKKFLPLLSVLIIVLIIVVIFLSMANQKKMVVIHEGNTEHVPIDIELNHYQDTQCAMTIVKKEDTVQAISPAGDTWFFDDSGCFALWYKNIDYKDKAIIWVYPRDVEGYIDARKAWYSINSKTAMGYGFAAFKDKKEGMISFDEMLLKMYRGENLTNPTIRKKVLGQ